MIEAKDLIMGLDAPNGGDVTVNGRHVHDLSWPLHEVGALLESRSIHPGRSAQAHLQMLAETNSIPRSRVDEVLEMTGLTSVSRRRAGKFSLRMTQRLGIASRSPAPSHRGRALPSCACTRSCSWSSAASSS
jgi:ABC-2 type transport system ATP-binding protein